MKNKITEFEGFAELYITQRNGNTITAIIDKDDIDRVGNMSWCWNGDYIKSSKRILLHHFIMGTKPDRTQKVECDHINRNKLDNRKCNLRIIPAIINNRNKGLISTNKTGYTGIYKRENGDWNAYIEVLGKNHWKTGLKSMEDAIIERKKLEEKYWGKKALT